MRITVLTGLLLAFCALAHGEPVCAMPIMGEDDRVDAAVVQDTNLRRLSDSTVAIFQTDSSGQIRVRTVGKANNLCPDELYYDAPTASYCSGVLIDDRSVLTAAHCLRNIDCRKIEVVFGYEQVNAENFSIPQDKIYHCSVSFPAPALDLGIIMLDRPVTSHYIAKPDFSEIKPGASVVTMGHPLGMPKMAQTNGKVTVTAPSRSVFMADLDNQGGASGSPVFSAGGGLIGIIAGFYWDDSKDHFGDTSDFIYNNKRNCYNQRKIKNGETSSVKNSDGADAEAFSAADTVGKGRLRSGTKVTMTADYLKKFYSPVKPTPLAVPPNPPAQQPKTLLVE